MVAVRTCRNCQTRIKAKQVPRTTWQVASCSARFQDRVAEPTQERGQHTVVVLRKSQATVVTSDAHFCPTIGRHGRTKNFLTRSLNRICETGHLRGRKFYGPRKPLKKQIPPNGLPRALTSHGTILGLLGRVSPIDLWGVLNYKNRQSQSAVSRVESKAHPERPV